MHVEICDVIRNDALYYFLRLFAVTHKLTLRHSKFPRVCLYCVLLPLFAGTGMLADRLCSRSALVVYGRVWDGRGKSHAIIPYPRFNASAHCARNHQQRSFRVGVGSAFPFLRKKRLAVEILVELVGEFHAHIVQYILFKLFPIYHFGRYFIVKQKIIRNFADMKVPEQIKSAAKSLIDVYGNAFDYLGKYKGKDAFVFRFPDDANTGFPYIYLFKDDKVTEITGFEALDILDLLVENLDEVRAE